jgi:penicillin V acylase-like amidase (Ntn superfamily)
MRNVSVPRGIRKKGAPNVSSTLWLTVADQKNHVYFYQDTNSHGALWVKLNQIDFKEGTEVRKLSLAGKPDTVGNQTPNFQPSALFMFLAPEAS